MIHNKYKDSEYHKKYYEKNKEQLTEKYKEYRKTYRETHKEQKRKYMKEYRKTHAEYIKKYCETHKEQLKMYTKHYRQTRRNYFRKYMNRYIKSRLKNDIKFRLNYNISRSISDSIKRGKNGYHWESLVGYTLQDLMKHLEKQFAPQMNWDNYGSYWHLDHIVPISVFNFDNYNHIDFKRCWALQNLQPLEKIENMKKHNKINSSFQPNLKI